MCSLEESDEAYQYIGLPGYNPHVKQEIFQEYHGRKEKGACDPETGRLTISDSEKMMLINAKRIFHIAADGETWQEREELARTYFEMVRAVEMGEGPNAYCSTSDHRSQLLLQIYQVNKDQNIYGFRPIIRHGYLYHRLRGAGYLTGNYADLKKRIDWTYAPHKLEFEKMEYICAPSYFKRGVRQQLEEKMTANRSDRYLKTMTWHFWPELIHQGQP